MSLRRVRVGTESREAADALTPRTANVSARCSRSAKSRHEPTMPFRRILRAEKIVARAVRRSPHRGEHDRDDECNFDDCDDDSAGPEGLMARGETSTSA
jgi:hypothetical protein